MSKFMMKIVSTGNRRKLATLVVFSVILNQIVPFVSFANWQAEAATVQTNWERDNESNNTMAYYAYFTADGYPYVNVYSTISLTDTGAAPPAGTVSLAAGARDISALEIMRCLKTELVPTLGGLRCPDGSEIVGNGLITGNDVRWPATGGIAVLPLQALSTRITFKPNQNLNDETILRTRAKWTYTDPGNPAASFFVDSAEYKVHVANLSITKGNGTLVPGGDVDGSGTITPGDTVRFPVTVNNNAVGNGSAYTCTLVDWPQTAAFTGSASQTQTVGTLAPGQSASYTFDLTIKAGFTGTATNKAGITCYNIANIPGSPKEVIGGVTYVTDTGTVTVVPNLSYSLSVSKTPDTQTKTSGQAITPWTITFSNTGTGALTGVTLVDTVPAIITGVSYSGSYTGSGNNISINIGALAVGASKTITVSGTAGSVASTATFTNTATADSAQTAAVNDSADITINPAPQYSLAVSKTPDTQTKTSGQAITPWIITVTNTGTGALTGVTLVDAVPAIITGVSYSGSYTGSGNNISINIGALAVGASKTITVSGTAGSVASTQTFTNTATADSAQTAAVNDSAYITINPAQTYSLSVSKTPDTQTKTSGQAITPWSIVVTNSGTGALSNVTVSDPVPNVVSAASASSPQGSCTITSGTVRCSLGTLAAGASATVTINGTAGPTTGTRTNTATADSEQTAPVSDTANITVIPPTQYPQLTMTSKSANPENPNAVNPARQASGTAAYTITLHADGGGNTAIPAGVQVTDVFGSPTHGGSQTGISNVVGASYSGSNGNHTFTTTGAIARNSNYTITYTGSFSNSGISYDSSSTITNTATIHTVPQGTIGSPASDTATVLILGPATPLNPDLYIKKFVKNITQNSWWSSDVSANPGDAIDYQYIVYNRGNTPATTASILDVFTNHGDLMDKNKPAQFAIPTVNAVQPGAPVCADPTGGASVLFDTRCSVQVFGTTNQNYYLIDQTAAAAGTYSIVNQAGVSKTLNGVPQRFSNAMVNVSYAGDFTYTKSCTIERNGTPLGDCDGAMAYPHDVITWDLDLTNDGTAPASVYVEDNVSDIRAYATIDGASIAPHPPCLLTGDILSCGTVTLAAGASFDVQFKAEVRASDDPVGWHPLSRDYTMDNKFGPCPVDDQTCRTTTRVLDLTISKTNMDASNSIAPPSSDLSSCPAWTPGFSDAPYIADWKIDVTNVSNQSIQGVSISDLLDSSYRSLIYRPGSTKLDGNGYTDPTINDNILTWSPVLMNGGQTRTVTFQSCYTSASRVNIQVPNLGRVQYANITKQDDASVTISQPRVTLQGYTWGDQDSDRLIDTTIPQESGISTIMVTLYGYSSGSRQQITQVSSDTAGHYVLSHAGLLVGNTYEIEVQQYSDYTNTGLNLGGIVGMSGGTAYGAVGGRIFHLEPLTMDDADITYNFGLQRKTGGLRVKVMEVVGNNIVGQFDQVNNGPVTVQVTGVEGFSRQYSNNSNRVFSPVSTGMYYGNILNKPVGWTKTIINGCHDDASVLDSAESEIVLCLKGTAGVQTAKYVRERGTTQWIDLADLGTDTAGSTVEYLILAWNNGTSPATINMIDHTLDNLNQVFFSGVEGQRDRTNQTLQFGPVIPQTGDYGCDPSQTDMATGSSVLAYCYRATLVSTYVQPITTDIVNRVEARQGQTVLDADMATIIAHYGAQLDWEKTVCINPVNQSCGTAPVGPGDTIRYDLRLTNTGDAAYQGYHFYDNMEDVLRYATFSSGTTLSYPAGSNAYAVNGTILDWGTIASLPAGAAATASFQVVVKDSAQWPQSGDFSIENFFGDVTTHTPLRSLVLTKTVLNSPIDPPYGPGEDNSIARYQIRVQNIADVAQIATPLRIDDSSLIPQNFTYVSGSTATLNPDSLGGSINEPSLSGNTIRWSASDQGAITLQGGDYLVFTFEAVNHNQVVNRDFTNVAELFLSGHKVSQDDAVVHVREPNAIISGYVWNDKDSAADIDSSESGLAHITVALRRPDSSLITQVTTNGNGYFSISNASLRIGGNYRLQVMQDSSLFANTGTNLGGAVGGVMGIGNTTPPRDTFVISNLDQQTADTTHNFGLVRENGTLQIKIFNANDGTEYTDTANPGTVQIVSFPILDPLAPYATRSIPPVYSNTAVTGTYTVDFYAPDGFADVTSEHESPAYQTTVPVSGTGVINLWISGQESLHISKYVYDGQSWVKSVNAQPGADVPYLVLAWNSGSSEAMVDVSDVLPQYSLFSSRTQPARSLLSGITIGYEQGAAEPARTGIAAVCDTDGTGDNYYYVVYCETLKSEHSAGTFAANNIASFTDGAQGSSQAVVHVTYASNAEYEKDFACKDGYICQGNGSSNDPFEPGDYVTYTLTIDNTDGTSAITNYSLIDDISDVLAYADLEAVSSGGEQRGNSLVWEGLTIPAHGTVTVFFSVTIRDSDTWTRDEYIMNNVFEGINATPAYVFDLAITKSPQTQTINSPDMPTGTTASWDIYVQNRSAVNTTVKGQYVVVKDILETLADAGFDSVNVTSSYGFSLVSVAGGVATVRTNSINAGATSTFTLTARNQKNFTGTWTNTAEVAIGSINYDQDTAQVSIRLNPLTLKGFVFRDEGGNTAGNGLINTGEIGLANVRISLRDSVGEVAYDFTDANGYYEFINVTPDRDYRLVETQPALYTSSWTNIDGYAGAMPEQTGSVINTSPTEIDLASYWGQTLRYSHSQHTYNFGEMRMTGDLQVKVWNVDSDPRQLFTPMSMLEVMTTGPDAYSNMTAAQNSYTLSDIATGNYNSVLAVSLGSWNDVTDTRVGCNRTATVTENGTSTINLCLTGNAAVHIDKAILDPSTQTWVKSLRSDPGDSVTYSIAIWNDGTKAVHLSLNDLLSAMPYGDPAQLMSVAQITSPVGMSGFPYTADVGYDPQCVKPAFGSPTPSACQIVINYTRTIAPEAAGNARYTITNNASYASEDGNGSSTAQVVVEYASNLEYAKSVVFKNTQTSPSSQQPATPGDTLVYTLSVTNTGTAEATNFNFRDDISDILKYVSPDDVLVLGGQLIGNLASWGTVNRIQPGETVSHSFEVTIGDSASWTGSSLIMRNAFGNVTVDVPVLDIVITKTAVDPFVDPADVYGNGGGITTWQVRLTNQSSIDLAGTSVYDVLPAGFSYVPGSSTLGEPLDPNAPVLEWILGSGQLPAYDSLSFSLATITHNRYAEFNPYLNCVDMLYHGDTYRGCGSVYVNEQTQVTFTKTVVDPGNARVAIDRSQGSTVTYEVVATNLSNYDLTSVQVKDVLPLDSSSHAFTYVSGSATVTITGSSPYNGGLEPQVSTNGRQTLTWNLSQVSSKLDRDGGSALITYLVHIPAAVLVNGAETPFINQATMRDSGHNLAQASAIVYVSDPYADLVVTKTDGKASVKAGTETTYTVSISNDGNSAATGTYLIDSLPSNSTFVSATALVIEQGNNTIGTYAADSTITGTVRWPAQNTTFTLPQGATGTATVTVLVSPDLSQGTEVINTATISSDPSPRDPDMTNNQAEDIDIVTVPQISIVKGVGTSPTGPFADQVTVNAGATVWYQITARNTGTAAETVYIYDTMDFTPFDLIRVNDQLVTGSGLTVMPLALSVELGAQGSGTASRTFLIEAKTRTTYPVTTTTVNNTASVSYASGEQQDSVRLDIVAAPSVQLSKRAWNITPGRESDPVTTPVFPGEWVEYTLTASNNGSAPTDSFIFTDDLSDVLDDVDLPWIASENLQFPDGGAIVGTSIVFDTGAPILPGQQAVYQFRVKVGSIAEGNNVFRNTYGNEVVIQIIGASLTTTKSVDRDTANFGDTVWFTVRVTNNGNQTADNVKIVDLLPDLDGSPLFQYAGETRGATTRHPTGAGGSPLDPDTAIRLEWAYDSYGQTFRLAPGASIEITYKAVIDVLPSDAEGEAYDNRAWAESSQGTSNVAMDQVLVLPFPASSLTIEKTPQSQTVQSGNEVDWTLTVNNQSLVRDESNVVVKDILPQHFTSMMERIGNSDVVKRAEISIYDANDQIVSPPGTVSMSPAVSYSTSLDQNTYTWPQSGNGFTIPKGGRLVINYAARAMNTQIATTTVNTAQVYIGSSLKWQDTAFVTIVPPPAPDVRVAKEVKSGRLNDGNPFVDTLTVNSLGTDNWVTYRIVASNPGTLGQSINLTDTVDFSDSGIYDLMRVYRYTPSGSVFEQQYDRTYSGSTIPLRNGLMVSAGSTDPSVPAGICSNCMFYIEARIRSDITNPTAQHENWARATDAVTQNLIHQDNALVRLNIRPALLTIIKEVKSSTTGWMDVGVANVDPLHDGPIEYRIRVTNQGDLRSGRVDVYDVSNALTPVIYSTVTDTTNGNVVYSSLGSGYRIPLLQNGYVNAGETKEYHLAAQIAGSFAVANPTHTNTAYIYEHGTQNVLGQDDAYVQLNAEGSLAITKSVRLFPNGSFVNSLTARPGDVVEYRIQVSNPGLVGMSNVQVDDHLDDFGPYHSSVYMADRDADTDGVSFNGPWDAATISNILPGRTESYTFRAVIRTPYPADDTHIFNTAYADQIPSNTTDVLVDITPRPNLAKFVSLDGTTFVDHLTANPGADLTYKVVVWNSGDGPVALTVADVLTAGDYASIGTLNQDADGNGNAFAGSAYDQQSITVAGNTSASHGAESFTFHAVLKSNGWTESATTINTASTTFEHNSYSDSTTVTVHVPTARITESKSAYNDTKRANAQQVTAAPGDVITYTLNASNAGDTAAANYIFSDDVSDILEYAAVNTPIPGTGSLSGTIVSWPAIAFIQPGQHVSRTFSVTVSDPLPETGDYVMNNTFGNLVQVPVGEVILNKSVTFVNGEPVNRSVRSGETVRYTLTATNNGSRAVNGFVFQDDVADILQYGTIGTISHSGARMGAVINWPATTINALSSQSRTFEVTVKDHSSWPTDADFTMTNIYGDEINVPVYHSEITVTKSLTTDPVTAVGQDVQFLITLTNAGEVPVYNLKLEDIWTTNVLDFVSVQGVASPTTVVETDGSRQSWLTPSLTINPSGVLTWDWSSVALPDSADDPRTPALDPISSLDVGSSISFLANYHATQIGQGYNEMHVWADDYLPFTVVEAGDQATVSIGQPVLNLTKSVSPVSVRSSGSEAERTVTYTLTLRNTSTFDATELSIKDLQPGGFDYRSGARIDGVPTEPVVNTLGGSEQLVWSHISVDAGHVVTITYSVVTSTIVGSHVNLAVLSNEQGMTLDTAQATVTITGEAPQIEVVKSASGTTITPESIVTYTVVVSNPTSSILTSVSLVDTLPPGFVYQSGATVNGVSSEPAYAVASDPQILTWSGMTLGAGQSATIVYRAQAASAPGYYTNVAIAQAGNISAQASTTVYIPAGTVLGESSFVSVLATTGSDLTVAFIIISLVLAAYVAFVIINRRRHQVAGSETRPPSRG